MPVRRPLIVFVAALTAMLASLALWNLLSIPAPRAARPAPESLRASADDEPAAADADRRTPARQPLENVEDFPNHDGATNAARIAVPPPIRTVPSPHAENPPLPNASLADRRIIAQAASRPSPVDPSERDVRQRRQNVQQLGGTPRTEDAVDAGLRWLAQHQSVDGSWQRDGFVACCPPGDRCPGVSTSRTGASIDVGLTGLALLAFLGAGHAQGDDPYRAVIARAVDWLIERQQPDGSFYAQHDMSGYNDSLATLALGEYFAATGDARLREPLQRAAHRLAAGQQPLGGWDYTLDPETGRNDTSITAWVVQALYACAAAGIDVPAETLIGASMHFRRASSLDGRAWYADAGVGVELNRETLGLTFRYGPAMSACALVGESLLGWRGDTLLPLAQSSLLLRQLPSDDLARGRDPTQLHSEYYWYYGTLAMFQLGGTGWERWNANLRDAILPLQERPKLIDGRRPHTFGSWPPYGSNWGKWGRMGGRVYTTAICTLTLEVYYRHTPAYLRGQPLVTSDDWRRYLEHASARKAVEAIAVLRDIRYDIGEPVLLDLLRDGDAGVALAAAAALAAIDSPAGGERLSEALTRVPPWERAPLERALRQIDDLRRRAAARGTIRMVDAAGRLATARLEAAWAGMPVMIRSADSEIARGVVVRRSSDGGLCVIRYDASAGREPQAGDAVAGE